MKILSIFFLVSAPLWGMSSASASPDHHNEHEHHEHEHRERDLHLSTELAHQTGIKTRLASGGTLQQSITLFGRLKPDPEHISHLRARFPGLIRQVNVRIGDEVKAASLVARVEANDSLRVYDIVSPIDGVVIERHANVGEYTGEAELFTLADSSRLELDLKVFARDAAQIRRGQKVLIYPGDHRTHTPAGQGTIRYITASDGSSPTLTAHVPLINVPAQLIAGTVVEALIIIAEDKVDLLIEKQAVQTLDDQPVVFVQQGDRYRAQPVVLGKANTHFIEVLSGLQPGEVYVVEQSFLLKADLEKSSAAHVH